IAARYALSSVGATGLAAGAMALLRNNFSDVQVATNKDFLETIKSIAKLRNKLNDFFQGLNNKVYSDKTKAETALKNEMNSPLFFFGVGSGRQVDPAPLAPIHRLVTQVFVTVNHDTLM
ncbi:transcriptional regulator, partial [Morganella morganii]|nr:transcriptional regulator [Morganella morganii]